MRIFSVAIALLFLGCAQTPFATPPPSLGVRVPLLTQQHPITASPGITLGCYLTNLTGLLSVDMTYGTRIEARPIMWPFGYTGFRVGSEVAVVNESGRVVAITGKRYSILDMGSIPSNDPHVASNPFPACGRPTPESEWWTPQPGDQGVELPEDSPE